MDADEVLLSCDELSLLSPVPSLAPPLPLVPAAPAAGTSMAVLVTTGKGARRVDVDCCNDEGEMASSMVERMYFLFSATLP